MKLKTWLYSAVSFTLLFASTATWAQRTAFVHLFEWSWNDIAVECENVLGPKGYAAVQVSPPQKSIIRSEWWSRYQPLSYEITGRGGSRAEFSSMVQRCQAVGVDIYVDAVINHMAALDRNFPEVPYGPGDFHNCTDNIDYNNRWSVQNCDLVGLNDLKTESDYVRGKIADYMNDMISLGVAGFRIDAAKHMPTGDIANIKSRLSDPNVYIFQEVIGQTTEPIKPSEYVQNGDVTEFNFERTIGTYFKGRAALKDLRGLRDWPGWLASVDAVTFVANHDDQRQKPNDTLTYKDGENILRLGEVFSLAYPYGYPKVMSSYRWEDHDQGPPANGPNTGDSCGANWVCEHRWREVANMVGFRNATSAAFTLDNWWDNGGSKIAFGRGDLGFVVINRESSSLQENLQTGLPEGRYCDIVNGDFNANVKSCSGPVIVVGADGRASFNVGQFQASAIHHQAKLDDITGGALWDDAYFRGTPNGWSTTAMSFSDGLWRTRQTFSGSNPRFKVARFQSWSEAYPAQDFLITEGAGTYDISFNDRSKQIMVTKVSGNNGNTVDITFRCQNGSTFFGQSVYAVGSIDQLGNWNPANAVKLDPTAYPTWSKVITVPSGGAVRWKCLKRSEINPGQNVQWEPGSDTVFTANSNQLTSGSF